MSYRELRNFTEMLRALGYPRLVSLENFRNPNFPLVAEILQWLTNRFDPSFEYFGDIDTEQDRVIFIRSIAQMMLNKTQLKLNTKKLYMSDGHAVQELLKIAKLLYEASKQSETPSNDEIDTTESLLSDPSILSKINELKMSRQLASEITQKGANLYDLLAEEIEVREQKASLLSRQLQISDIEESIQESIKELQNEIENINFKIDNVANDETNLDSKIEKKKSECERIVKRLQTLRAVRPAFMDEYEKLEEELTYMYESYITKFRCLTFLEQQLQEIEQNEMQKIRERDEQISRMIEHIKQEEMLRTETETGDIDEYGYDNDDDPQTDDIDNTNGDQFNAIETMRRPMLNTVTINKRSAITGKVRMFGSITDEHRDDSLDSDLDVDQDDDDASDLDSEEEIQIINMTNTTKDNTSNQFKQNDSDNDF